MTMYEIHDQSVVLDISIMDVGWQVMYLVPTIPFCKMVCIFLPSKPPPFLPSLCPKTDRSSFPNWLTLEQHPIILSKDFKSWVSYHVEQGPFCKIYCIIQIQESTCVKCQQSIVRKVKKVTTSCTSYTCYNINYKSYNKCYSLPK